MIHDLRFGDADGVLRLGRKIKAPSKKRPGEMVDTPTRENHFVMKPVDFPDPAFLQAIRDKYGPEPTELPITFYSNDPDVVAPHFFEMYQGDVCLCRGDGRIIVEDRKEGQAPRPCLGRDCPNFVAKKCRYRITLWFYLQEISLSRQVRTQSHGWNSLKNCVKVLRPLDYQVKGQQAILRLVPMSNRKGGWFSLELEMTGKVLDLDTLPSAPLPPEKPKSAADREYEQIMDAVPQPGRVLQQIDAIFKQEGYDPETCENLLKKYAGREEELLAKMQKALEK